MAKNNPPGNLISHIHTEDYEARYTLQNLNHTGMIHCKERPREQLNGMWHFTVDPYDTGLRDPWFKPYRFSPEGSRLPWDYDPDGCELIPVPSCWNLIKPEYFYYEGSTWYAREFSYSAEDPAERVFLRIGAAHYSTVVFLNEEMIGHHFGGSTPFFAELTGKLKKNNLLQICVNNKRTTDRVPMRNTDWFNYGGIYREVELFRLPEHFIKEFSLYLVPDRHFNRIALEVTVSDPAADDEIELTIPELKIKQKFKLQKGMLKTTFKATPDLWSPDQPKRYGVQAVFRQDRVADRIGFREIRVDGTSIILNGKETFLRGICVHEDDAETGKMTSREDILRRFNHAKELGCNFLRLAHYPHHELAAELADELGFLIWEEIPVYWAIDFANPVTYQDAENQLLELIKRDMNRASVIIWSVGNENADTDDRLKFMKGLADKAHAVDPTRLVSAACLVNKAELKIQDRLADALDVIGINEYYGWYEPDYAELISIGKNSAPGKPVIISETGADARAGYHSTKSDMFSEEYMEHVYKKQVEIIRQLDYVKGISPWILYDFRASRRFNQYQQGYNRKGLIAADKRTKKLAFYVLQQFYREKRGES